MMSYLTEIYGTGIDVVPILPTRPVPEIPAVWLGTYRTEHALLCLLFKTYFMDYQLNKSEK